MDVNGIYVERRPQEELEPLLKRFKKLCSDDGILSEIKKKEHFVKPSLVKREKMKAAIRRERRERREKKK